MHKRGFASLELNALIRDLNENRDGFSIEYSNSHVNKCSRTFR